MAHSSSFYLLSRRTERIVVMWELLISVEVQFLNGVMCGDKSRLLIYDSLSSKLYSTTFELCHCSDKWYIWSNFLFEFIHCALLSELDELLLEVWCDVPLNHSWVTVYKMVHSMLSDRCLSVLSVCDVRALWPNGWTDQDETWHAGGHIVLDEDPAPLRQRGTTLNFRPISLAAKWLYGSRCYLVWS